MKQTADAGAHVRAIRFLEQQRDVISRAADEASTWRPWLLPIAGRLLDLALADSGPAQDRGAVESVAGRASVAVADQLTAASVVLDIVVERALVAMGDDPDGAMLSALCQILNRATARALASPDGSRQAVPPWPRRSGENGVRVPESRPSRLARELHDHVGQSVEIAYRNLEIFEITSGVESGPDQRIIAAQHALRDALLGIRAIISDARRPARAESLAAALGRYISSVSHYGLDVLVAVHGEERWAPAGVLDEVFVVVREALHNAVRHADATKVEARIDIEPFEVQACVLDDGVGFDRRQQWWTGGVGLRSMMDRAAAVGGSLVVDSVPGVGSRVSLVIPLNAQAACAAGTGP